MMEKSIQNRPQTARGKQTPGKVNWWLRMTSTGWDKPQETIEQREITRRSQLLSWILLGTFVAMLAFIPALFKDTPSVFAVCGMLIGLVFITFFNRRGWITLAGVLMVLFDIAASLSVIVGAVDGQIHVVTLPAYDFLVLPVIVGASILPRFSAFIIAAFNIGLIYADLIFQKHAQDLQPAIQQYGLPVLAGRPSAILIITAVIAYLWVRGMDRAVERADRAEELHALEQYLSQLEAEHTASVKEFVQEIINALSALANGQEGLLLLPSNHPWQQQAIFINTQLKQFYRLKQAYRGNPDQWQFASETLLRLLKRIYAGQSPINSLDPRRFSTHVPVIDEITRYIYVFLLERPTGERPAPRPPSAPLDPFAQGW